MKAVAINGSPRKGWNTENLLRAALRGAEATGAETRLIQLYELSYTGCKSCFGCKLKGRESCRCVLADGLSPVLEEIFTADAVFIGTPIYFGDMTGQTVSLMERLAFPLLSYDDYSKSLFKGKINAGVFFTMNAPAAYYKSSMEEQLTRRVGILRRLGGELRVYAACDTYQFEDYGKYHAAGIDEAHKRELRETQFPKDLEAAFQLGRELVSL